MNGTSRNVWAGVNAAYPAKPLIGVAIGPGTIVRAAIGLAERQCRFGRR